MSLVDHWTPARLGAAMLLLSSCASGSIGSPNQMRGNSGSVEWEVVDMGEVLSRDRSRIRWSYTIVIRETSGSTIEFETVDKNAYGDSLGGINVPAFSSEFQR